MPSLPLVKELLYAQKDRGLEADVDKAEAAALALGELHLPEAFEMLRDWWQQTRDPELRRIGLLAIAMQRQDQSLEFLFSLIAEGMSQHAKDAIKALSLYQQDPTLWQQVRQTVEQRGDANLRQWLETDY